MRGEQQKTRLAGVQDSTQESLVFQDREFALLSTGKT